ncbi:unnamed protein product [Dracunculus medinensis]|uniref:CACTA en-spm transposon protein n=1 Tax=Dracunculus medinensis TaxID=318479 RepID=A0A0N4UGP6_DRAME|nr:unnamed protein product [Dracunculus medinensis]
MLTLELGADLCNMFLSQFLLFPIYYINRYVCIFIMHLRLVCCCLKSYGILNLSKFATNIVEMSAAIALLVPQSDIEDEVNSLARCPPYRYLKVRIFDISDLPYQVRDDFPGMVGSRCFDNEIAGLMDGNRGDQPTLKRFSRYNQSMYSPSSICVFEPSSSSPSFSSPSQAKHSQTCSKNGKFKAGMFSGHWTLRDKKEIRPSIRDISVLSVGKMNSDGTIHTNTNKESQIPNCRNTCSKSWNMTMRAARPKEPFESNFNDETLKKTSKIVSKRFSNQGSYANEYFKRRERIIPIEVQENRKQFDLQGMLA